MKPAEFVELLHRHGVPRSFLVVDPQRRLARVVKTDFVLANEPCGVMVDH